MGAKGHTMNSVSIVVRCMVLGGASVANTACHTHSSTERTHTDSSLARWMSADSPEDNRNASRDLALSIHSGDAIRDIHACLESTATSQEKCVLLMQVARASRDAAEVCHLLSSVATAEGAESELAWYLLAEMATYSSVAHELLLSRLETERMPSPHDDLIIEAVSSRSRQAERSIAILTKIIVNSSGVWHEAHIRAAERGLAKIEAAATGDTAATTRQYDLDDVQY